MQRCLFSKRTLRGRSLCFVLEMINQVTPPDTCSVQAPSGGVTPDTATAAGYSHSDTTPEQQRRARQPGLEARIPDHQDASGDADNKSWHLRLEEDQINPNNMIPESIQAMIDQALLRNSTNGDGSHSSHEDNRRNVQTVRPCTALTWWNGQIKTLGSEAYAMTWEVLKKKMTDKYCPQGEIKKLEIELWNLKVKGNDVPAYTERFQELTLICTNVLLTKLIYGEGMSSPIELEHKAYWALKHCNYDLKTAGDHQKVQLNELNELRDQAYENSLIYKERTKDFMTPRSRTAFSTLVIESSLYLDHKIFTGNSKPAGTRPFHRCLKFSLMERLNYLQPTDQTLR
ncbi:putative reverse transcriptase domain-containing protein [Tanacetum coccineum]